MVLKDLLKGGAVEALKGPRHLVPDTSGERGIPNAIRA
jgi:hypothetical protein